MNPSNDNAITTKPCPGCGAVKPIEQFSLSRASGTGRASRCKVCLSRQQRERWVAGQSERDASRLARESATRERRDALTRTCSKCGIAKDVSEFYTSSRVVRFTCKVCDRTASVERRTAKGIDSARKYGREYYAANREKISESARAVTPRDKINNMVTSGVSRGIRRGTKNGRRSFDLVGYSLDDLIAHIEKQFESWMTWENYGFYSWHIDHIRPLSSFNYKTPDDPEFKEAWALSNLRPLGAVANWKKGGKWLPTPADNDNNPEHPFITIGNSIGTQQGGNRFHMNKRS